MDGIAKLRANSNAMHQEAFEMLKAEAAEDERLRGKHGTDRWIREPSHSAGAKLQHQVEEYAGILESADNSDKLVRGKLNDCEAMLKLLGGDTVSVHFLPLVLRRGRNYVNDMRNTQRSLQEFVPNSARATLTPRMDREVGKLRQCLNEVSRLESRRRRKIESLREKAKADDISMFPSQNITRWY